MVGKQWNLAGIVGWFASLRKSATLGAGDQSAYLPQRDKPPTLFPVVLCQTATPAFLENPSFAASLDVPLTRGRRFARPI